jgi:hypothetical protein
MDDDERRKLLSTAFEPRDDGYLYYRNRWANGVRVSAEEREQFILSNASQVFQLGREFAKRAPATPPRHPSPWLIVDAMPYSFVAGLIAVAFAAAAEANRANPMLPSTLFWVIAILMAAAALTLVARRIIRQNGR